MSDQPSGSWLGWGFMTALGALGGVLSWAARRQDSRTDRLDNRTGRLENIAAAHEAWRVEAAGRFDRIEAKVDRVEAKVDRVDEKLDRLIGGLGGR